MSNNILKEEPLLGKITELLGTAPSELWLDIAWDVLTTSLGYEPSEGLFTEEKEGNNSDKIYLVKRPVTSLTEVILNKNVMDLTKFKIYQEIALKYIDGCFIKDTDKCNPNILYEGNYGVDELEISYVGGYTADNFPNDLLLAVAAMIQTLGTLLDEEGNLKAYKISDISYTFKSFAENSEYYNSVIINYR